jgi:hypothetical protein
MTITTVPTHAMMAYENIHCYSYILKPIDQDLLEEQLFTLIKFGTKKTEKDDVIKIEDNTKIDGANFLSIRLMFD